MNITFPERKMDVAELEIDGKPVRFRVPPVIGTHSECFAEANYTEGLRRATKGENAAYVFGALVHRQNEWGNQSVIKFPDENYLRAPYVLTIVPKKKKFGELEGAMIVDEDLKGEGIEMITSVSANLSGWKVSEGGILKKDNRIVVPYDKWYTHKWDANNGAVIALFGQEGGELLEKSATDSGRKEKLLWRVNPSEIVTSKKRVLVVDGSDAGRLILYCCDNGNNRNGCAVRVLN